MGRPFFNVVRLGLLLGVLGSTFSLATSSVLRKVDPHRVRRERRTDNANPQGPSPRCELVQKALVEVETLIDAARPLAIGSASRTNTEEQLNLFVAKLNRTSLRKDSALMSSKSLHSLASQLRRESSLLLNDLVQSAAKEATNPVTKDFLRTLRLCASCDDYDRVGEMFDGGYIICADGLKSSGLVGAYSYGINGYDGWGMDIAERYDVPLFEYDCFDKRRPDPCSGCNVTFVPQCLEGNNRSIERENFHTFSEHVARNGHSHAANSSIMLKIDIEGAEWDVFAEETETSLQQVRQITAELHHIQDEHRHGLFLKAMQSLLDAGFSVTHLHGNNHGPMLQYGPYSVPAVLEISLIRRSQDASKQCPDDIPYSIPEDQRCDIWRPELPDAKLPS